VVKEAKYVRRKTDMFVDWRVGTAVPTATNTGVIQALGPAASIRHIHKFVVGRP